MAKAACWTVTDVQARKDVYKRQAWSKPAVRAGQAKKAQACKKNGKTDK